MNKNRRFLAAIFLVAILLGLGPPGAAVPYEEADEASEEEAEICLLPMDCEALRQREKEEERESWPAQAQISVTPPPTPRRWTDEDVAVISRMVWGEGRGVSANEQKLIAWTVINRLEDGRYGNSLIGVVRARGQFHGYSARHPITPEIRRNVVAALEAWDRGEAAKVYPPFAITSCYRYFWGDGRHNWFRTNFRR